MRLVYINPNSTEAMTQSVVAVAAGAAPAATVTGMTNGDGPPAIQGAADGAAALPGLLARVRAAAAAGADAIVIACFDDTGLAEAQRDAPCPVLGIGQSAYLTAALLGLRFSVVTSTAASVPVIEENIEALGFRRQCASVRASGLQVLAIEDGSPEVRSILAEAIVRTHREDGGDAVVLGCAGMSRLRSDLESRTGVTLIDGVAASAVLAAAAANLATTNRRSG
jgi:allantoin racemase